jgi:hypothetical protein
MFLGYPDFTNPTDAVARIFFIRFKICKDQKIRALFPTGVAISVRQNFPGLRQGRLCFFCKDFILKTHSLNVSRQCHRA